LENNIESVLNTSDIDTVLPIFFIKLDGNYTVNLSVELAKNVVGLIENT
jgi:hypothetical protein